MMSVTYTDVDPRACAWLQALVGQGTLSEGDVVEADVGELDVSAAPEQVHFFAGIGGWAYALELAGWEGPVWTGSCPCQPFSCAGGRCGFEDERHVWPAWRDLVEVGRPPVLFGEQVASPDALRWFDRVTADLEALGYEVLGAVLPACSVGAPHIRRRLFFGATRTRHLPADLLPASSAPWEDPAWVECSDGFWRPFHADAYPRVPAPRGVTGMLRGYGNALVPQVAQTFAVAFCEAFIAGIPGLFGDRWEALEGFLHDLLPLHAVGSEVYSMRWKRTLTPKGQVLPSMTATSVRARTRGWPTSTAKYGVQVAGKGKAAGHAKRGTTLAGAAATCELRGWSTPTTGGLRTDGTTDADLVSLRGWGTPTATLAGGQPEAFISRKKRARERGHRLGLAVTALPIQAATSPGAGTLNPAHARWLMGFPPAWDRAARRTS